MSMAYETITRLLARLEGEVKDDAGLGGLPLELLAAGEDAGQVAGLVDPPVAGGRLFQEGEGVARAALGGMDDGFEFEEPGVD